MKSGNILCKLCKKEFEPTRRGIQKFCSSKCRKKYSYHKRKTNKPKVISSKSKDVNVEPNKKNTIEKMSLPGVGNAATGALIVQLLTQLLTKVENKPATKRDIQEIKDILGKQYFQIYNMPQDPYGRTPYFNMATSKIVYWNEHSNQFELTYEEF